MMKNLNFSWAVLILVLAGFIQAVLIPFNFVLLLLVLMVLMRNDKELVFLIFIGGLILDLFLGRRWGFSSLVFLAIGWLIMILQKMLGVVQPVVVFAAGFLAELINERIAFQEWYWGKALIFALALMAVYYLMLGPGGRKQGGLKLEI